MGDGGVGMGGIQSGDGEGECISMVMCVSSIDFCAGKSVVRVLAHTGTPSRLGNLRQPSTTPPKQKGHRRTYGAGGNMAASSAAGQWLLTVGG